MHPSSVENLDRQLDYTLPDNFVRSGITAVETGRNIDPEQVFDQIKKTNFHHIIWKFQRKRKVFHAAKPISVKVYREEDLFFVENETLNIYGAGDTLQTALEDFNQHVIYFFEYYKKISKSKLIGEGLKLKEIYNNLLIEENNAG